MNTGVSAIDIFPNPAIQQLNLTNVSEEVSHIEIFDSRGVITYEMRHEGTQQNIEIDVALWPEGLYWVFFYSADQVEKRQISINRN